MSEKTITRIDLEAISPTHTRVRQWYEGWCEGSETPDIDKTAASSVYRLLVEYEKQGFTCSMRSQDKGQALRGKITRIDFLKLGEEYRVQKWPYGWEPKTRPLEEKTLTQEAWEQAILGCESNGWTVRRWPGGARAFLGQPQPVRDRAAIMAIRRRAEEDLSLRHETGTNKVFFDFAFDW